MNARVLRWTPLPQATGSENVGYMELFTLYRVEV
jgi:hypothetical protein